MLHDAFNWAHIKPGRQKRENQTWQACFSRKRLNIVKSFNSGSTSPRGSQCFGNGERVLAVGTVMEHWAVVGFARAYNVGLH